jgi:3-deoxy-D-manno-octulosonic acid (KDO) 8-phosphate synthase
MFLDIDENSFVDELNSKIQIEEEEEEEEDKVSVSLYAYFYGYTFFVMDLHNMKTLKEHICKILFI